MDSEKGKKEPPASGGLARVHAVKTACRLKRRRGASWSRIAAALGITSRTLYVWRRGLHAGRPVGRPRAALDPSASDLLDDLLTSVGPDIGMPTLRALLPWAARGPLERRLRTYRLDHRRRRRARLYRLTWVKPGSVWAVDLADPPAPVEGGGRAIFAVRDLASRYAIEWIPLPRGTAKEVTLALRRLFRRHGAPLILKSDNGSCFVAPRFRAFLARAGVVHLRSPRAWPQYNGACEAGIGWLRALTDAAAATRGEPDAWAFEDLDEARERANDLLRPGGVRPATAREVWKSRQFAKVVGIVLFQKGSTSVNQRLSKYTRPEYFQVGMALNILIKTAFFEVGCVHGQKESPSVPSLLLLIRQDRRENQGIHQLEVNPNDEVVSLK